MTSQGNIKNQDQGPDSISYIPPPQTDFTNIKHTEIQAEEAAKLYYTDTQSEDTPITGRNIVKVSKRFTKYYLNSVPPPNAQAAGVAGAAGAGNPNLSVNPLVSFFMSFNKLANILRELTAAQEKANLVEMSLVTDLAQGEAEQIKNSAQQEANMYIATAATSFAEAGASMGQFLTSLRARSKANLEVTAKETELNENIKGIDGTEPTMKKAEAELTKAQQAQDKIEQRINGKTLTSKEEQAFGGKTDEKLNQDLIQARSNTKDAQEDYEEKKGYHEDAVREQRKFLRNKDEEYRNAVSIRTDQLNAAFQAFSKTTDALSNVLKRGFAIEKGRADAIQKMMSAYQQTAYKMMDTLQNAKSENTKMISELMQLLKQFSDAAAKTNSSITAHGSV